MYVSAKDLLRAGAMAAAITAIGGFLLGAFHIAQPVVGGPLPFASKKDVVQLAQTIDQVQNNIKQSNQQQAIINNQFNSSLALTQQLQLESALTQARLDMRHAPSQSTQNYICSLITQVDKLRAVNGLPPVPPC